MNVETTKNSIMSIIEGIDKELKDKKTLNTIKKNLEKTKYYLEKALNSIK